ncbi:MAG: hypothetical protein HQ567_35140, partial [Candidatus Nealsonbacteria bacterium]|nr:hypothetical protein [Candidatus Nealsonbacteria bacterium]
MNLPAPFILSIVWLLAAAGLATPLRSAEPEKQPVAQAVQPTLRFRRVYAPADQVDDWPLGTTRYLPMEAAEFERLLAVTRATAPDTRPPDAAAWTSCRYQARLAGDRLVDGKATLQVVHSVENPVLLPLDPCGLAVGRARWEAPQQTVGEPTDGESTVGEQTEAVLGLGDDGKLQVLVGRSGGLNLDWSLSGSRDASGEIVFQVELPPSPANRLVLDVPEQLMPWTDVGTVLPAAEDAVLPAAGDAVLPAAEDAVPPAAEDAVPPADQLSDAEPPDGAQRTRRWQIELGGRHRFRLKIIPHLPPAQRRPATLVRGTLEYHFSLRGMELLGQWELQTQNGPLEEIALTLDSELLPISAQYGSVPLSWTVVSEPDAPATQLILALPEAIRSNGGGTLTLRALAPLVIDRRWRLPRARLGRAFWQEGRTTLLVPAALLIESVIPTGCRQTGTGPLAPAGESAEFQCFSADAELDVLLRRHRSPVRIASGTAVELDGAKMTAEVRADFRLAKGSQFSLQADLNRQWEIDTVETFPADALEDWSDQRRGSSRRTLSVRLAKALSPQRPIRLRITAHRLLSPLGRSLGVDDLAPLRFRDISSGDLSSGDVANGGASGGNASGGDASDGRRLIAVRTVDPYQLELSGTERLNRIDKLDAAEAALFEETPRALLFADDGAAAGLQVALQRRRESYSAEIRVDASVAGGKLREHYTLRCTPKSPRVDRVMVHFSHPRDARPVWTLGTASLAAGGTTSLAAGGT